MARGGVIAFRRKLVAGLRPITGLTDRHPRLTLAGLLVGTVALVGTAVDYSNAMLAKADLQSALDVAAQTAVGDLDTRSDEEVKQRVEAMIQTRLLAEADIESITVAIDRPARRVRCQATARVEPTISSLIGNEAVEITASSDVVAALATDGSASAQ